MLPNYLGGRAIYLDIEKSEYGRNGTDNDWD